MEQLGKERSGVVFLKGLASHKWRFLTTFDVCIAVSKATRNNPAFRPMLRVPLHIKHQIEVEYAMEQPARAP